MRVSASAGVVLSVALGSVPDMGVKVRVSRPTNATKDLYEDVSVEQANYFRISDGMLFLYTSDAGDAQLLNVYNRESWLGAWLSGEAIQK